MKKREIIKKLIASMLTLTIVIPIGMIRSTDVSAEENTKTASQRYVEAMGKGWNLGNSFDGFMADLDEVDTGETAWGNPIVTKEFIHEIKNKGFKSIRIPFTVYRRYSFVDGKYVIDQEWIDRYKEVVNWAIDEGLYVMINVHHDSWIWLADWDGNKDSVEYKMYVDIWKQIADEFKDIDDKVCFETINEPRFNKDGEISKQERLDMLNITAYDIIRKSGGKNDKRMIVMPTMDTSYKEENSTPLYSLINGLNDENIIATIHYYSEWVFSANLGITGFDETLFEGNQGYTARTAADEAFDIVYEKFTKNGIGVVVGEWGLLGYDSGNQCNQLGEELKYYDYINYLSEKDGISIMFWDNGSGINRLDTENYSWKKKLVGNALEAGINGERSSYATGLDTIYLSKEANENLEIELTLNGNEFVGIEGLVEGIDYTYNSENSTVTLLSSFVNSKYNTLGENSYGTIAELVMKFSEGANWHQYLVKYTKPVLSNAEGTTDGISIPSNFNGANLRRTTAVDEEGNRVGNNSSWWKYLKYTSEFVADYEDNTINLYDEFLGNSTFSDGKVKLTFEFYDGQTVEYTLLKEGSKITGIASENNEDHNQNPEDDNENPEDDQEPGDSQNPGNNNGNGNQNQGGNNQKPGANNQNQGGNKNDGNGGNINVDSQNTKLNNNKKLPQTGSVISTTLICSIALLLV